MNCSKKGLRFFVFDVLAGQERLALEEVNMATSSQVEELHILWITAGLGCDGDTISITAATQPSIEDVLMGAIPGLPKVQLHNPVLAFELGGDSFMTW